jgi:hypothetical protein
MAYHHRSSRTEGKQSVTAVRLQLLCDVLSSAHVTLLPLAMTALDLCSLSMLFGAVLPTHRTMFWPPCSAVFSVLSCVQAIYQQDGR